MRIGKSTLPDSLALNPRFVEALMGWPDKWTDCGFSETVSSRRKQLALFDCSGSAS